MSRRRLRPLAAVLAVAALAAACTAAPSSSAPSSSAPSSPPTTSPPGTSSPTTSPPTTGSSPSGSTAGEPLTAVGMKAIVAFAIATNTRANAAMSFSLLGSYEAGTAYAIDAAGYTEFAKARSDCDFAPFGFRLLESAVLSTSYPRRFVALGTELPQAPPAGCQKPSGPCPQADSIFVFEQAAPGAAWKIVLEPSADTGRVVEVATSGARAVKLPAAEAGAAARLPSELSKALQSYESTGRLGVLSKADFGSSCWVLPDPHAAAVQSLEEGVDQHEVYSVLPGAATVPLSGGHGLVVFTLGFVTTLVPAVSGGAIDWVSDPSSDPVSGLLAAGDYSRIVERGDAELAVETTGAGSFRVIGAYVGATSVSGTRLQSPTTTPGSGSLVSSVRPLPG